MATLNTYTTEVQNLIDDTSNRAKKVIEFEVKTVYNFVINDLKHYLIRDTDTEVAYLTDERHVSITDEPLEISQAYIKETGDDDWSLLRPMTPQEYTRCTYRDSDKGRPNGYYYKDGQLSFDRIAETGGTLRIIYIPTQNELTGSVESVIPDNYAHVIVHGATAGVLEYEGDSAFQIYEQKFKRGLEQMRRDMASKQPNETRPRIKLYGRR